MQGCNPEKSWTITATDYFALIMIPFQRPWLIINVLFYRDPEEHEAAATKADAAIIVSKIIKAYY